MTLFYISRLVWDSTTQGIQNRIRVKIKHKDFGDQTLFDSIHIEILVISRKKLKTRIWICFHSLFNKILHWSNSDWLRDVIDAIQSRFRINILYYKYYRYTKLCVMTGIVCNNEPLLNNSYSHHSMIVLRYRFILWMLWEPCKIMQLLSY